MADRKKAIKGLEEVDAYFHRMTEVCYRGDEATFCDLKEKVADAIAMLKEQEPKSVESIQMDRSDKWGADLSGYCPSCKRPLKNRFNKQFCGECGQAVKWDV